MKIRAIVTAAALFAGMVGPSFAFEGVRGIRTQSLVTSVSCDVLDEDKQALCARACDDAFIKNNQSQTADLAKIAEEKKSCDAKCGCPQNTE